MGRVIEVKFRQPSDRGMYFPQRKIYFPPLYRSVVKWEWSPGQKLDDTIYYTIDTDLKVFGSVESQIVDHVLEEDGPTVVIRHHLSQDDASLYLDGVVDAGISFDDTDVIIQTNEGFFTLIRRPSPGEGDNKPFVFHNGFYTKLTPWADFDYWESRTDRFGRTEVGEFLHDHGDNEVDDTD